MVVVPWGAETWGGGDGTGHGAVRGGMAGAGQRPLCPRSPVLDSLSAIYQLRQTFALDAARWKNYLGAIHARPGEGGAVNREVGGRGEKGGR